jgi:hypothetical protein
MDTMKLCHVARKGKLLYVMKKYYIYETTWLDVQMNKTYELQLNPTSDIVYSH